MKKAAIIGAGGVGFGKHREASSALKNQIEILIVCDPSSEASAPMREWAGIPAVRMIPSALPTCAEVPESCDRSADRDEFTIFMKGSRR